MKIGDDGLSGQLAVAHHLHNLVIIAIDERKLELVLKGICRKDAGVALAVKAVHVAPLHTSNIDGHIECADDAVVA